MLVGHRELSRVGLSEILYPLAGPATSKNFLVVAPMGVLALLCDTGSWLQGRRTTKQLVKLPHDLTAQMRETILGLYDAEGTGAMGNLAHVVEAARVLCQAGARA